MDFAGLRAFIIDLDGCVYNGETLLPGVEAVLDALRRSGRRVLFLTNNSRQAADELLGKLRRLGIPAAPEEIISAAEITGPVVRARYGPSGVLAAGSTRLLALLAAAGHTVLPLEDYRRAQVVVIGHDDDFGYGKLTALSRAVRAGAAVVAGNLTENHTAPPQKYFLITSFTSL